MAGKSNPFSVPDKHEDNIMTKAVARKPNTPMTTAFRHTTYTPALKVDPSGHAYITRSKSQPQSRSKAVEGGQSNIELLEQYLIPVSDRPISSPMRPHNGVQDQKEVERNRNRGYQQLVGGGSSLLDDTNDDDAKLQDMKTTPIFSGQVRVALRSGTIRAAGLINDNEAFTQYGLLGVRQMTYNSPHRVTAVEMHENLIFSNMDAPWSAFICGSQGAGKSHSLSCMLENSLLATSLAGVNPQPLAGLVFHYDKFTGPETTQLCEAAYLCSSGIPVRVLVSRSNFDAMNKLYSNMPGLPANGPRPQVIPLYFREEQLNISRMLTLMAVKSNDHVPLYMEVVNKILRDMSLENKGTVGVDYMEFKARLSRQEFQSQQAVPLRLRLQLLESFLADRVQSEAAAGQLDGLFKSAQGTLTIVDLSCPFVNENDACALFSICMSIFLENRGDSGRILALDEAHKFLTRSGEAQNLTTQIVSVIRQQRHLGTRVVIATQEPTIAPELLDLCNVALVHHFNSPAWLDVLRNHLPGANLGGNEAKEWLMAKILGLRTGEAFVFCPTALLDVIDGEACPLEEGFIKIKIRSRLTADGGKSLMASEKTAALKTAISTMEVLVRPFGKSAQSLPSQSHPPTDPQPQAPAGLSSKPAIAPQSQAPAGLGFKPATLSFKPPTGPQSQAPAGLSSKPAVGPKSQPPVDVEFSTVKSYLCGEVTKSLKENPRQVRISAVRIAAAEAAGLPRDTFTKDGKWKMLSNEAIRIHAKKYAKSYGIAVPSILG